MISLSDIEAAARLLDPVIRKTPLTASAALSQVAGRPVYVKPEHLQRTGSFKIRGAYNFIAALAARGETPSVVAASAGNHAQGVALAASLCGLSSTIFMPSTVSLPKLDATRGYGATVHLTGTSVDDCIGDAKLFAQKNGAIFVPPFDDEAIICGQATIGLEIVNEAPGECVVLVPVGGGGLIAGVGAAIKQSTLAARVIGVEAAGATSLVQSMAKGMPVRVDTSSTMADGIAVRSVSPLTLSYAKSFVDEVVTVEEEQISAAVLLLAERCKWVVEPAGAVGLAALLSHAIDGDEPVVVVLSGGNIDPLLLMRLIEHGLSAAGRYLMLRIVTPDRPGQLAALTAVIASLGLNVLSVDHHRSGVRVAVDEVEVLMTLETRDPEHRDSVVPALVAAGFAAEILN